MPDLTQNVQRTVSVEAVVPVLIGHESRDQNAYRCQAKLAHHFGGCKPGEFAQREAISSRLRL
jgi:hypothetical protein